MTDGPTPTTLRRQLGARLRQLRQERGETAQQVADALGFSISKVSRMESGARAVSEPDIEAIATYFNLHAEAALELTQTARAGRRRRDAWVDVATTGTDFQRFVQSGFVELERDAEYVREFNSGVVPGLLQTARYMRAMMQSSIPRDKELLERAISLRLSRQNRLDLENRYAVIVDEAALARWIGGADVMAEQMHAMLQRIDSGAVKLRVIPFTAGFHAGLNSVFVALKMGVVGVPDVVFVEGLVGFQQIDGSEDVGKFEEVWRELAQIAVPSVESRRILESYEAIYHAAAGERLS
ncbi:helix-turn-helix domain-containing protein [Actinomycetospora termitidis]|uniref:Helix-turn-helix transcriptional regulator n=1 Tax=Actinomycetospora termitidis TaxID=3053470 RepID=A0ABT7MAW2_9PSEU|nr:helix-turn-helix transcriptional regulator [Actinomycetospora sp. Odt1-22]MDL5157806.1 helix-turn-helix transcriptional regulator [Actinomycetospora sp. Odt1-22]